MIIKQERMKDSRSISIKEKILIVCQVIVGGKIQAIARKHKVSRPSIYAWTQKALGTLEQTLKLEKRGPKFKKSKVDAKDETIEEQKEKIAKLEGIISEKEKQIKNLKGKLNLQKNSFARPSKCPHCGFEKIYKNGTYKIKPERFFEQLKKDQEGEITVQQFICPYCRSSVYMPEKKRKVILF
jgi:cell division protein FtsB